MVYLYQKVTKVRIPGKEAHAVMGKRKDKTKGDDYIKSRKKFRKAVAKHVLVCESKMDNDLTLETFHQSELIRKARNELTGIKVA